jgi:hypothetical protein
MQDSYPRVGTNLSLPFDSDPLMAAFFGDGTDPLGSIRDGGMTFVELPIKEDSGEKTVLEQVRKCHAMGLDVDLHPYHKGLLGAAGFQREPDNRCLQTTLALLQTADRVSREQEHPCVLNFHPASNAGMIGRGDPWDNRRELTSRSVDFFLWAVEQTVERGLRLVITAEFQCPPKPGSAEGLIRVGDTFQELMEVAKKASPVFGICWDTGHAHLAHLLYDEPVQPPEKFFAMVRHVHLHNVDELCDHMPLGVGSVPYRDHIQSLLAAGFQGDINIELHHRWCVERGHLAPKLSESADLVRSALGRR